MSNESLSLEWGSSKARVHLLDGNILIRTSTQLKDLPQHHSKAPNIGFR